MIARYRADAVALAVSLAVHFTLIGYVLWSTSTPELDFEFQLPIEVEFGLTDAVEVSGGPTAAPPEPSEASAMDSDEPGEGQEMDAGVPADAGPSDAGPSDAGPSDGGARDGSPQRRDAGPSEPVAAADLEGAGDDLDAEGDTEAGGGEGEGAGDGDGDGRGVAFLPAGSQIALRLDVSTVRRSPLAPDVRALLAVLPDWQVLLDGSGIEPLDDLDRILIATPNLRRSRIIVAGRATGDQSTIRQAATRLAIASSQPIEWTRRDGVDVAPWHDRDETERVIAIIGPRHFIICRPEDLSRVLAVARNRAAEEAAGESPTGDDEDPPPAVHPADALLSMAPGEGLSLEVEGARNFARASRRRGRNPLEMLPTELRLALSERPNDSVAARTRWTYENDDQAESAGTYWNRMREQFSRNIIASVLGVDGLLGRATLEPEGDHVDGSVDLSASEMRQLLNLSRQMFLDRARARERARQRREAAQQQADDSPPEPEPGTEAPAPPPP